jgi:hypothetical protein
MGLIKFADDPNLSCQTHLYCTLEQSLIGGLRGFIILDGFRLSGKAESV